MNGMILLLAITVPTVNYGWRPGEDGQQEYIVQIEAETLEALRNGQEISSAVHPDAGDVRRFVLRMGDGEVPRISPVQQSRVARAERLTEHAVYMLGTDRATHGWQPGSDGRLEYIIQLDDNAIEALEAGDEITSEIASEAGEVDRFVVRFGNAELPREPVMAASAADNKSPPPEEPPTARLAATQTGAAPPRSTEPSRYDAIGSSNPAPSRNATPPAANVPDPYAPAVPQYAPRQDSTLQGAPAQPYRAENPANSPQATYAPPPTAQNPVGTSSSLLEPPTYAENDWATSVDPDDESTTARIGDQRWAQAEPTRPANARQGGQGRARANDPRWAQDDDGYNAPSYPEYDWRDPAAGRAAPPDEYSRDEPAGASPPFSRPAGNRSDRYSDRYEADRQRVAQTPRQESPRTSSLPRSSRAEVEPEYVDELSPSSEGPRTASRAAAPPDEAGSLLKELVLFASLGINVVAILIARQYYLRYRMLIREMRDPETTAVI